jgi:energy-coupling factor transporter ATP-binding protein EcfA2
MAPRRKAAKEEVAASSNSIGGAFHDFVKTAPEYLPVTEYCKTYGLGLQHALPLQYALSLNVLALGKCILLVGPPHGGKTTFMWELNKVVLNNDGLVNLYDTEGRVSMSHLNGILQMDEARLDQQIMPWHIRDLQDMMQKMQEHTAKYMEICSQYPIWQPLSQCLDSLSAVTSISSIEAMIADGENDNNMVHAQNANKIAEFFRGYVPNRVQRLPFLMVIVNHQKPKIAEKGKPKGSFAPSDNDFTTGKGGVHKDYQSQYTFEVKSSATKEELDKRTNTISSRYTMYLKMLKCSSGPKQRKISIPVCSEYDHDQIHEYMGTHGVTLLEATRQCAARRVVLNWDVGLMDLILDDKSAVPTEAIKKLLGITGTASNRRCAHELGITTPVTDAEIGAAIHANPQAVQELGLLMGVDQSGLIWAEHAEKLTPLYNALYESSLKKYGKHK